VFSQGERISLGESPFQERNRKAFGRNSAEEALRREKAKGLIIRKSDPWQREKNGESHSMEGSLRYHEGRRTLFYGSEGRETSRASTKKR